MDVTSRLLTDSSPSRGLCGEDRCGNPSNTDLGIVGGGMTELMHFIVSMGYESRRLGLTRDIWQDLLATLLCAAHDTAHRLTFPLGFLRRRCHLTLSGFSLSLHFSRLCQRRHPQHRDTHRRHHHHLYAHRVSPFIRKFAVTRTVRFERILCSPNLVNQATRRYPTSMKRRSR
jgi:hypothetical protein